MFVTLNCAFRYGREDLDVLGLSFRKDLFARTIEVFPAAAKDQKPLSQLQDRLLTKLGQNAHPFTFTVRPATLFYLSRGYNTKFDRDNNEQCLIYHMHTFGALRLN